ncbi:hypothetical protein P9112_008554 [Eukaryota sp. TZLM1-RC]
MSFDHNDFYEQDEGSPSEQSDDDTFNPLEQMFDGKLAIEVFNQPNTSTSPIHDTSQMNSREMKMHLSDQISTIFFNHNGDIDSAKAEMERLLATSGCLPLNSVAGPKGNS